MQSVLIKTTMCLILLVNKEMKFSFLLFECMCCSIFFIRNTIIICHEFF